MTESEPRPRWSVRSRVRLHLALFGGFLIAVITLQALYDHSLERERTAELMRIAASEPESRAARYSEFVADIAHRDLRRDFAAMSALLLGMFLTTILHSRTVIQPLEAAARAVRIAKPGEKIPDLPNSVRETSELIAACNDALSAAAASERKLADTEHHYQQIVESAHEGIWLTDTTGRTTFVNKYMADLLGYPVEELTSKSVMEFLDPSQKEFVERTIAERRAGRATQYDFPLRRKDGSKLWVLISGAPLRDSEGNDVGTVATVSDITARKKMEEDLHFQQTIWAAAQKIASLGASTADWKNGTFRHTEGLVRMLGLDASDPRVASGPVSDFMTTEDRHRLAAENVEAMARGVREPLRGVIKLTRADGKEIYVSAQTQIQYEGDKPVSNVTVFYEITEIEIARRELERQRDEIKKINEQLQALSEQLVQQQERERQQIARELHDNLGQLLTALKMDIGGLVAAAPGSDERARYQSRVFAITDELLEAIQTLSSELRPVDFEFGLPATIEHEARLFEERTAVEVNVHSDPGLVIDPDTSMTLFRILREALTNIARHAEARRVEITLAQNDEEGILTVADDGIGIPPGALESRSSLGIMSMRERAEAAGMRIHIAPSNGGTMVSVHFNRKKDSR